jgi:hypothetical protein
MGLFDMLRYPISDKPTKEEIEAIPDDIFNKWVETSFVYLRSREEVIVFFNSHCSFIKYIGAQTCIDDYRKLIKEYDELI